MEKRALSDVCVLASVLLIVYYNSNYSLFSADVCLFCEFLIHCIVSAPI